SAASRSPRTMRCRRRPRLRPRRWWRTPWKMSWSRRAQRHRPGPKPNPKPCPNQRPGLRPQRSPRPRRKNAAARTMAEERLQKILAQAGIASRRKAEQLMLDGRVSVNGEIITELGTKADAGRDQIKVDGTPIRMPKRHVYIAVNKPREVVTTLSDPQGRTTVMHLLKGVRERVFPVGRLD